jgi:phenylalanyl-tRNA synthetase beta chain
VIADHERAVALAAIMGGAETEISDATTNVLLEAANFEPFGVYRTSERLGLRTEGSNRWEKGVDPHVAPHAARLATQLVVELTGARWVADRDVQGELPEPAAIELRPHRVSELIGLDVPPAEQIHILTRLGFRAAGDTVIVPTWRARDVTRQVDLVEEIARFRLDDVPFTLPERRELFGRLDELQKLRRTVEDVLVGAGLVEAYTPSLVASDPDPGALRLSLPMTSEQSVLRTTLLPSLLEAAARNREVGNERVELFEIARVYLPAGEGELPDEQWRVGGVVEGGYLDAKGVVDALLGALKVEVGLGRGSHTLLHPGKTAELGAVTGVAGTTQPGGGGWAAFVGVVGEVHPAVGAGWAAFELDLEALLEARPDRVLYQDVLTYPAVRQDLAFVVAEDVPAAQLAAAMREAAGEELREVRVFDEYRSRELGEGKRSLAFRVAFQSAERTLSDEDAQALRARIVEALAERFGAELRA